MTRDKLIEQIKKKITTGHAKESQIEAGADYVLEHGVPDGLIQVRNSISVTKCGNELITETGEQTIHTPITAELDMPIASQYVASKVKDGGWFVATKAL